MKKTKINLGCGRSYLSNHINCDINKKYKADKYFDMELPNWPFLNNTVDYVLAKHVLEHLSIDGYFNCFKEIYRICKNNSIIEIHYPHHLSYTFFSDPTHKISITVDGLQLFSKEFNATCDQTGMSHSRLAQELDVDFLLSEVIYCTNAEALQTLDKNKNWTMDEIHNLQGIYGNIVEELRVKLKVIK